MDPVPQLQQPHYSLRKQNVIRRIRARTDKFKASFYPSCLTEGNEQDAEIRLTPSVAIFKKKLIFIIRPPGKIQAQLSSTLDPINPICPTNDSSETTEHSLLRWASFEVERRNLHPRVLEKL